MRVNDIHLLGGFGIDGRDSDTQRVDYREGRVGDMLCDVEKGECV